MKAIILVAGIGNRLKPFTKIVPKCLTEVNGEPILLNALEILDKKLKTGEFKEWERNI